MILILSLSRGRARFALLLLALIAFTGCTRTPSAAPAGAAPGAGPIRIGFFVPQPEEPWFQLEWKFAEQAAQELGFSLIKIAATDGEKVLRAIDSIAANGAQGLVICTPDPLLGPAIVAKARAANLKLLTVDDQFVGADGRPMTAVPYLGISARTIGENVGDLLHAEMRRRGWRAADTGVCMITFDTVETSKERTDGAAHALTRAGFPADRIFRMPQRTPDVPGSFDAANVLLTQRAEVKHWLVCGQNDSAVLGAVRALEARGFGADRAIGIGINGTDCIFELEKVQPTAFHGSILLSARQHGYETAAMMYRWIKDGTPPPPDTRTTGMLITRENFRTVLKEQGVRD